MEKCFNLKVIVGLWRRECSGTVEQSRPQWTSAGGGLWRCGGVERGEMWRCGEVGRRVLN